MKSFRHHAKTIWVTIVTMSVTIVTMSVTIVTMSVTISYMAVAIALLVAILPEGLECPCSPMASGPHRSRRRRVW